MRNLRVMFHLCHRGIILRGRRVVWVLE